MEIAFIDLRFALFSSRLLDGYVQCMCCKSGLTDRRLVLKGRTENLKTKIKAKNSFSVLESISFTTQAPS